jgi:hypothetical protein
MKQNRGFHDAYRGLSAELDCELWRNAAEENDLH